LFYYFKTIFLFCMYRRFIFGFLASVLAAVFFAGVSAIPAKAAEGTLSMAPGSGEYELGSTFTVQVQVDSGGDPGINAAEGTVNFDNNLLSVTNVSKSSSIFDLWTEEPSYSNSDGTVTFGGGSPSPFTGSAGTVLSITFSPQSKGDAQVTISNGVVLAADGQGTNVFSGAGNATYSLIAQQQEQEPEQQGPTREELEQRREERQQQEEEEEQEEEGMKPPKPDISSPTHPDPEKWYADNNPEFEWKILPSLTGISYNISQKAEEVPDDEQEGVVETKQFEDVEDGEWYFHLKYQNKYGWGETTHYKFRVDATRPEKFSVSVDDEGDATNPTPKLVFHTQDETSGLDHYNLKLADIDRKVSPDEVETDGFVRTDPLQFGEYDLNVAAVDLAGNAASSTVSFTVEPLRAPVITSIPEMINKKTELAIRGTSFYSNATVKISIRKKGAEDDEDENEPEVVTANTDSAGNWSYYRKAGLEKGTYEISAQLVDERGAQSRDSSKYLLHVKSPSILESFGWLIIAVLVILIGILISYILYQKKRFIEEKTRIQRETREVKSRLSKIFQALREEVDELIVMADKKPGLSESERKVKEKLEESLDIAEEFIGKEVGDVEKEIKVPKQEEE